jgi:hypothetical protein
MDIDFSGLWSWTVPLWALFILVLFLVGVLNKPIILEGILPGAAAASAAATAVSIAGGASTPVAPAGRRVRFAGIPD